MAITVDYTPALFNYYLSGIDDAIEYGTETSVDGVYAQTTVIDGVTWTKTHESAVQADAGTATDTHVITSSDGFSATGVELVNYSGPNPVDWDIFDDSEWVSETWTGDFGDFVVAFSDGANGEYIDTFTGTMATVSGDLLENVNIVLTFEGDSDFPSALEGTATLNGEVVTFDSSLLAGGEAVTETTLDDVFGAIAVPDAVWDAADNISGSITLDGVVWSYTVAETTTSFTMIFSNDQGYTGTVEETLIDNGNGVLSASGSFIDNAGTDVTFEWVEDDNAGTWTETLNGTVGSTYTFNNFSYTENWSTPDCAISISVSMYPVIITNFIMC